MTKELQIGKDYGEIFGLDSKKGQHLIYNGGYSWTGINGDVKKTFENKIETTNNALEYINQPSTSMGNILGF
jgi:hypothetical protein